MEYEDSTLVDLLDLNNERFVIDDDLGFWVKFQVQIVERTFQRPHGVRYSLTLHDRKNHRIMGFDNSHAIEYGGKINVSPQRTYDHWHRSETDKGRPYVYQNAGRLLEDFWIEVDKVVKTLRGMK